MSVIRIKAGLGFRIRRMEVRKSEFVLFSLPDSPRGFTMSHRAKHHGEAPPDPVTVAVEALARAYQHEDRPGIDEAARRIFEFCYEPLVRWIQVKASGLQSDLRQDISLESLEAGIDGIRTGTYDHRSRFHAYLRGIARNKIRHQARQERTYRRNYRENLYVRCRGRGRSNSVLTQSTVSSTRDEAHAITVADHLDVVLQMMELVLTRKQRFALMCRAEGMEYAEIARREGVTPAAIRKRVSRARKRLEDGLRLAGFEAPTLIEASIVSDPHDEERGR